jgi:hypothetical protein
MTMLDNPRLLLHLEGAAGFGLATCLYRSSGFHWGWFLLLFLWPDLAMLGYLVSVRFGAQLYNFTHTTTLPILMAGLAYVQHGPECLAFALIWIAHITFDRALGYGLKYPTHFKDTHMQRVKQAA